MPYTVEVKDRGKWWLWWRGAHFYTRGAADRYIKETRANYPRRKFRLKKLGLFEEHKELRRE